MAGKDFLEHERIDEIIAENERRLANLNTNWDPLSGRNSTGLRKQWRGLYLPAPMFDDTRISRLLSNDSQLSEADEARIDRVRIEHDFPYWAAKYVWIKPKRGGDDVNFVLNYAQRKLVNVLESMRTARKPIRLVLLKARQWGGSTCCQIYMAWLQLVHKIGLNSLIIAHQGTATSEIKDMFDRLILNYPRRLLYAEGEKVDEKAKVLTSVGTTRSISRVPQRKCKIKLGTAEKPDSCRGGDYSLVHLSEVGMWRSTKFKKPEDIVRSACSGVLYEPLTMVVYESTANGIGNFFHREYSDACQVADCQFKPLFVAWYEIEQNSSAFADDEERRKFATQLFSNREKTEVPDSRHDSGQYTWWLWQQGATLEGIRWYMMERSKHTMHESMASECPTDDIEAFANSGANVFDRYDVEALRADCKPPSFIGEIYSRNGAASVDDLYLQKSKGGQLMIWEDADRSAFLTDRYVAVVDIGGETPRSDWSVVAVFDREPMLRSEPIRLVAQWRGHPRMTPLGWNAARIAAYYNNALLVIESNTVETRDPERDVTGYVAPYLFMQLDKEYHNIYKRRIGTSATQGARYETHFGFHTNTHTKPIVIEALKDAVINKSWIERDEQCLNELLVYERRANNSYGALAGCHDDLLMTRAIGMHICYQILPPPHRPADYSGINSIPQIF